MTRTIVEPERRTPVLGEPQVLVVGGGAAGIAAACAAARSGVETLLNERFGFLGGTLTAVTLGGFCGTHAIVDDSRLARVVVDSSGDGDVAAFAGADYALGDVGRTQAGSTMFRLAGVDTTIAGSLRRTREVEERPGSFFPTGTTTAFRTGAWS